MFVHVGVRRQKQLVLVSRWRENLKAMRTTGWTSSFPANDRANKEPQSSCDRVVIIT